MIATSFRTVAGPALLALAALPACAARTGAPAEAVTGRWAIELQGALQFVLVTEIEETQDGGLRAMALNGDGAVRIGSVRGGAGRLALTGVHAGTEVRLDASITNGVLAGEWRALLFRGPAVGRRLTSEELAPLGGVTTFERVWEIVARRMVDPRFVGPGAGALRDSLMRRAEGAQSDAALAALINEMLHGSGLTHTGFGAVVPPQRSASAPPGAAVGNPVEWRALDDSTGYIRVHHFGVAGAAALPAMARVDTAFAGVRLLPRLVLDLRGNPGGTLDLAAHMAARLSGESIAVGVFATQAGLSRRQAARIADLVIPELPVLPAGDSVSGARLYDMIERLGGAALLTLPGGRQPYTGRVAVLIDGRTASTAEAAAAALQEHGRAILVGSATAGAMLSSATLPIASGWELRIPVMDFVTPARVRLEGRGVMPDVPVPGDAMAAALRALAGG